MHSIPKRYSTLLSLFLCGIVITVICGFTANDGTDQEYVSDQKIHIPSELSFAGEPMPLDNFDVRESLERELITNCYFHSSTILLIKRANRWFPLIEKILAQNGIPDDFKYMVAAESGFTNITSPAQAVGFWQIMKKTATELGIEVNDTIDERYSVARSTEAACKYIFSMYIKYRSWTMAAAAYNTGPTNLDEQIARQKEGNYYDLLLNAETGRYVYRIAALKLILSNPEKYGFEIDKKDLYYPIPVDTIKVDSSIADLAFFAQTKGTSYKVLKIFNPWLRDTFVKCYNGKTYYIELPKQGYRNYQLHQPTDTSNAERREPEIRLDIQIP